MTLERIAEALGITPSPTPTPQGIQDLTQRADEAGENSLFVCIRGTRFDGHVLAKEAYGNGCRLFVAERPLELPADATVLIVPDTRRALGRLSAEFYRHPSQELSLVGITGTKGKTTTALLLRAILEQAGIPTGYIGTNGIDFLSTHRSSPNTTPDARTLQATLREMQNAGVRIVLLEVSSQAMLQHRVEGCHFDTLLFTNLYSDHIGPTEHASLAEYAACKHRLFTEFTARSAIFCSDAPGAQEMQRGCLAERILTVSTKRRADATAREILPYRTENALGVSFTYCYRREKTRITLPLLGTQNVDNALLAVTAAREFGISPTTAAAALAEVRIEGRSEVVPLENGALAVIDYAHNGESLSRLLSSLRDYSPTRLTVLFGSVGERTQMRREELGRASAAVADLAILTSDNPGSEDPDAIIDGIAKAFLGSNVPYLRIPDRREAILSAVRQAIPGEILVLAGKGHEDYQLIGREKVPFSERSILLDALSKAPVLPKS